MSRSFKYLLALSILVASSLSLAQKDHDDPTQAEGSHKSDMMKNHMKKEKKDDDSKGGAQDNVMN